MCCSGASFFTSRRRHSKDFHLSACFCFFFHTFPLQQSQQQPDVDQQSKDDDEKKKDAANLPFKGTSSQQPSEFLQHFPLRCFFFCFSRFPVSLAPTTNNNNYLANITQTLGPANATHTLDTGTEEQIRDDRTTPDCVGK